MITENQFLQEFNGHNNAYSSYMVIGPDLPSLLHALNEIDPKMCVGSGKVNEKSISFEICKELPDLIYSITEKLQCKGFADIGAWYGEGSFIAAENGKDFTDFTANWEEGNPYERDDDGWDAFVVITDNESQEKFYTGEGACEYDVMKKWEQLVRKG